MRLRLLAVGTRVPDWVSAGFQDYARRLPPQWGFSLKEIPASKRRPPDPARCKADEGARLLAALTTPARVIALDERGRAWRTEDLALRLEAWLQSGQDVAFMIGGPDGLAPVCLERADERWSLSALTLPHALVRVIVAEQLYRASTMLRNHPYHRR
ncbi:MAG: 23S rRNA (pseudouridine(1915)-N(3))-methyltransferase RlmH [Gammaproteobacteria bacterium]